MSSIRVIFCVLLCLFYAKLVIGQKENTVVIEKIQDVDMDILNLKSEVTGLERKLSTRVGLTQEYLKAELVNRIVPEYTYNQVQEALASIFADRTIEDIVSGYVVEKLNTMSGNFQNLRRNVHVLSRRLRDVERDRDVCKKSLKKQSGMVTAKIDRLRQTVSQIDEKLNTTFLSLRQMEEEKLLEYRQYVKNTTIHHRLLTEKIRHFESDVSESRELFTEYKQQRDSDYRQDTNKVVDQHRLLVERVSDLEDGLNNTLYSLRVCANQRVAHYKRYIMNVTDQYEELTQKVNQMEHDMNATRLHLEQKMMGKREQIIKSVSTSEVSLATPTSASVPTAKNMDLLIAAHAGSLLYFQRLDLHTNSLSNFPLRITNVHSIMYVPSRRSVLISDHDPHILSYYNIDTQTLSTVRKWVIANGMALDEIRQQIFMATQNPRSTVSSMNVDGQGFRGLVDITAAGGSNPQSIAVDSRHKMIYVCVSNKLLRVEYDGHIVQTISRGSSVQAVGLDISRELLYFNEGKKVVRTSFNGTKRKQVFELEFTPRNFVYYNESIYIGRDNQGHIDVLFLGNMGNIVVQNRLQTLKVNSFSICLIPRPGQ